MADEVYLLYADRPEWRDVQPVLQDDGPHPACPIAYSAEFRDAMDYFRAVLHRQEMSDRALELVTDVITFNAANYTVWHFRRMLLERLGKDLRAELEYTADIIRENAKNYQVWYHRRAIVERLQDGSQEPTFVGEILAQDAKNYHAWTHLQWAMEAYKLFDGALDRIDLLLNDDVRNNSAWSHRHFVINKSTGWTPAVVDSEVAYTLDRLLLAPSNESACNYLRGVCAQHGLTRHPEIEQACLKVAREPAPSPYVLNLLLEIYTERLRAGDQNACLEALEVCARLKSQDDIRQQYWSFREDQLKA